jgi:predicted RNA-binding protein with PIN domain
MLLYIVDGFNLVHKIPSLKRSLNPHSDLIQYIKNRKLTGSHNNKVIIVFDGAPEPSVQREREFEILFSLSESADNLIKKRISRIKVKSEVVVVSDDREIIDYAKKEGARFLRTADFIKIKLTENKEKDTKDISFPLQAEITQELRKIWLKE